MLFMRLACTCGKTCEFVWPPNASLHPLATTSGPFGPGLKARMMERWNSEMWNGGKFPEILEDGMTERWKGGKSPEILKDG